jgi:hypothetical protein
MTLNYLGLGIGGYMRIQKESTWGTAATGGMTVLPVESDSIINYNVNAIENATQIGSRFKQKPDKGRETVKGTIKMNAYPDLLGTMLHVMLGTATSTGTKHVWFAPMTGDRVDASATIEQALGGATATRFTGSMINSLKLGVDTSTQAKNEFEIVAQDWLEGVTRATSLVLPTVTPFKWDHLSVVVTPSGGSAETIQALSCNFELNLNYDMERFRTGSVYIAQPTFEKAPEIKISIESESAIEFKDWANDFTDLNVKLTFTHTTVATGSTPYSLVIEVPGCRLNPEFNFSNTNDRHMSTLDLIGDFGGTTTNSGATVVLCEITLTDDEAAYA